MGAIASASVGLPYVLGRFYRALSYCLPWHRAGVNDGAALNGGRTQDEGNAGGVSFQSHEIGSARDWPMRMANGSVNNVGGIREGWPWVFDWGRRRNYSRLGGDDHTGAAAATSEERRPRPWNPV